MRTYNTDFLISHKRIGIRNEIASQVAPDPRSLDTFASIDAS